jgi:hypothetical protein
MKNFKRKVERLVQWTPRYTFSGFNFCINPCVSSWSFWLHKIEKSCCPFCFSALSTAPFQPAISVEEVMGEDVGGWKQSSLLHSQLHSGTDSGLALQESCVLCLVLPPRQRGCEGPLWPCWELLLKPTWTSGSHCNSEPEWRRPVSLLSPLSHLFPAHCLIWNPATYVLVDVFIKMCFSGFWNRGCPFFNTIYMHLHQMHCIRGMGVYFCR